MPDAPVKLEPNLQYALGPASLLSFESIYLNRNFRRRFFVEQINESPSHQLRAKTQISVFGKRVVLPAAAHLDRFAAPDSGGAVEVKKIAAAIARSLLDDKVTIEHDRLQTREQIVRTIDVGPTHLRAADDGIREVVHQLAQKVRPRHKVGIEDRNHLALRCLHAVLQSACFESRAIVAVDVVNIETVASIPLDRRARDVYRLIR